MVISEAGSAKMTSMFETELEEGKVLRGKFTLIESLNWEAGGGTCFLRGQIEIIE